MGFYSHWVPKKSVLQRQKHQCVQLKNDSFMHEDADDIHSACLSQGVVRAAGALSTGDVESTMSMESMITIRAFVAKCYSHHKLATNACSRAKYCTWDTKQAKQNREITEHLL